MDGLLPLCAFGRQLQHEDYPEACIHLGTNLINVYHDGCDNCGEVEAQLYICDLHLPVMLALGVQPGEGPPRAG